MSDQSLHDTATDLVLDPAAAPRPWCWSGAAGWAAVTSLAAGGIWFAALSGWQYLVGPALIDSQLVGDLLGTAIVCAAIGALYGVIVGGAAGFLRGRPPRVRSAVAWGSGFAVAAAVGGGVFPLVVAVTPREIPSEVTSAVPWAVVGAVVGGIGYMRSHQFDSLTRFQTGEDRSRWHPAGAVGWAVAVGGLAAGAWLGELALLRWLPEPVVLGPLLRGSEVAVAVPLAILAGGIGLVVGFLFGLLTGGPSRWTAAVVRGLGFMAVAAVGGGLFPLVVAVTSGRVSPEVSSALTWAVVCAVAAVIAYARTRRPQPEEFVVFEDDERRDRPRETVRPRPMRAGGARVPGEPAAVPGEWAASTDDESATVVVAGWDPEPVRPTRPGLIPVASVGRAGAGSAALRVAPVLMVSVVCLLAVGLSSPSPVGWAMLAVGLLGLAATWAFVGQERRIRELERQLAATGRPEPRA